METKYQKLFPTLIMQAESILTNHQLNQINVDITKNEAQSIYGVVQSEPNLHKQKIYQPLCRKILELNKKYLDDSNLIYENIEITDMWSNIIVKGQFHRPHTHSNNILSGVFYPKSDNTAKIYFTDPRPQAVVLVPKSKFTTHHNNSLFQLPSITNQMIIFPSWLQHYVEASTSDEPRHSIAWNIMLKGLVGDSYQFQSATF